MDAVSGRRSDERRFETFYIGLLRRSTELSPTTSLLSLVLPFRVFTIPFTIKEEH